ncbi:hypothetical protein [Vulcanisaeta distributa]|uniref:hypothetical protein n=1 Tax=Vulcanisaeta distributa TaxID=164451 RepID=UPI001FB21255|nr:hypothetical protein [Vulcanisaeta distributa]
MQGTRQCNKQLMHVNMHKAQPQTTSHHTNGVIKECVRSHAHPTFYKALSTVGTGSVFRGG